MTEFIAALIFNLVKPALGRPSLVKPKGGAQERAYASRIAVTGIFKPCGNMDLEPRVLRWSWHTPVTIPSLRQASNKPPSGPLIVNASTRLVIDCSVVAQQSLGPSTKNQKWSC